jgi:two-component system, cell cycle sensor histidine kinase and response regulator CckA
VPLITDPVIAGLLEAAPDATVCVDSRGRIALVNEQAERLFGYPREELAGQPVEILVPDAVSSAHYGLRAGYAADPRRRPMGAGLELSGRRRDGTTFPAEISLATFDTGQALLVLAAIRDVTEQRQAARAQAWLASIIESAHDAVVSLDLDGRIRSWNPGAERLYGYPAAEIIGRNMDVLIPADHRDDVHKHYAALARGEKTGDYQADRIRKDGTGITVMATTAFIADKTGTITGISVLVRDISARQRADARFRGLLEAAPDAIVCVDSSGRIVLVNAQAERMFGYPREELAGQLVEILVPDAVKAAHSRLRAGYAADPHPRQLGAGLDLFGRRRDGTAFPAEISLSALDTGQGVLVSAAVRDATQQQQTLDDLRRTNQNLQQLGYSIAHDLRTPLRSLAGFSALLIEEYADALGEAGRNYAERIESASRHIGNVLDALMHLSRIARAEISLQPVDLGAEAAAIAADLQRQDPARSVRFTIQPQAWALADAALIREALDSLLGNAWKFTAGRDGAAIEFGMTAFANARVCCFVRDNGAGFDPAYADKLFTPFERLHSRSEFAGTGIGLACVREIVDRHGGRAWAEGAVGEGATFFFTLQAAEPAARLLAAHQLEGERGAGGYRAAGLAV